MAIVLKLRPAPLVTVTTPVTLSRSAVLPLMSISKSLPLANVTALPTAKMPVLLVPSAMPGAIWLPLATVKVPPGV